MNPVRAILSKIKRVLLPARSSNFPEVVDDKNYGCGCFVFRKQTA